jgi:hypothetical protein
MRCEYVRGHVVRLAVERPVFGGGKCFRGGLRRLLKFLRTGATGEDQRRNG